MHTRGNALVVGLMQAGLGITLLAQTPDAIPPAFEAQSENAGNAEGAGDPSGLDAFGINTQLACKDGQYMLAGTLSPKDSKGEIDLTRKVMVFVKCDTLTVR